MDRSWMNASRITEEYENGVEEFLQFAQSKAEPMWGKFFCPCVKCANGRRQTIDDIRTQAIRFNNTTRTLDSSSQTLIPNFDSNSNEIPSNTAEP